MYIITRLEKHFIESINNENLFLFKRLLKKFNFLRKIYLEDLNISYHIHTYITIKGKLKLLKWLFDNDYIDYTFDNIPKLAVKYNHLHIVKWCLDIEFDNNLIDRYCAKYNNTDILTYLHQNNYNISPIIPALSIQYDNIDVFKWCVRNNIEFDHFTPIYAAKYNKLNILKWCHKNNILINYRVGEYASINGNTDILTWLHKKSYPISYDVYYNSILFSKINVLEWCVLNNYIYDDFLNFLNLGFISEIDLDKQLWRDYLFIEDLSEYPYIETIINNKKYEVFETRKILLKTLNLPTDIIKYCINPYI